MYQHVVKHDPRGGNDPSPSAGEWMVRIQALWAELRRLEADVSRSSPSGPLTVDALVAVRRRRTQFFDESLFSDPAWDILLELHSSERAQRRISVSKLSFAIGVPGTTVLRWLTVLDRRGLIERHQDPHDARRSWVCLSDTGSDKMANYFASIS